jgi:hypothetical protein
MGQKKQQEVPCKQQQTAALRIVLNSPSMRTAELMTGGSKEMSLAVTDYTVS